LDLDTPLVRKAVSFVSRHLALLARRCVWVWAVVWLSTVAIQILDATFHFPIIRWVVVRFGLPAYVGTWLEFMKRALWPVLPLLAFLVIREEAQRWLTGHPKSRVADRLVTTWFVYVATLFIVDQLSPEIKVIWPISAIDATLWLAVLRITAWLSYLLHTAKHRRLWSRLCRRLSPHLVRSLIESLTATMQQRGAPPHVSWPWHLRHHGRTR